MPKKYTDEERRNIRLALMKAGGDCLSRYGVRRTTVDELVHLADIPKGTFYLFYPHKEALFLDMIRSYQDDVDTLYPAMLAELDENHIVTSLTDVFMRITMMFYERGLYRFLDNAELDVVLRKYGDEEKVDIGKRMDTMLQGLFSYFAIEDEEDIRSFRAGYEALLYMLLSYDRLHDKEKALRFLIRGLVLQMVE